MRRDALNYFACPNCGGELTLREEGVREEREHVMAGTLACAACAAKFSIRDGVPILLPANLENVKLETASRFAEEWTRWSDLRGYYEQEFFDWIAPVTLMSSIHQPSSC